MLPVIVDFNLSNFIVWSATVSRRSPGVAPGKNSPECPIPTCPRLGGTLCNHNRNYTSAVFGILSNVLVPDKFYGDGILSLCVAEVPPSYRPAIAKYCPILEKADLHGTVNGSEILSAAQVLTDPTQGNCVGCGEFTFDSGTQFVINAYVPNSFEVFHAI
jgi:hypothetical protein